VVTATPSPAGATASNNTATTGTTGAATFSGLTLRGAVGSYTLSFGGGGLTPATSGAIALGAGTAASSAPNGGGTSAPVGTAVNPPPSVIVRDASGNPVSGVAVTFAASPGSSTVTPTTPVTTGTDGIAAATSWILGPTAGPNTVTATATGLAGSPVTFTATGTAGAAPFSGCTLSGTVGNYTLSFGGTGLTPVSSGPIALSSGAAASIAPHGLHSFPTRRSSDLPPPSVIVRDASGNPVSGVAV